MKYIAIALISCFVISCNQFVRIEKRHYRNGYSINSLGKPEKAEPPVNPIELIPAKADTKADEPSPDIVVSSNYHANESAEYHPLMQRFRQIKIEGLQKQEQIKRSQLNGITDPREELQKVSEREFPINKNAFAAACLALTFLIGFIFPYRKISSWAKNNKIISRSVITVSHLTVGFGTWYAGFTMSKYGIHAPTFFPGLACGIASVAILAYPFRKHGSFLTAYPVRKSLEFSMLLAGLLLIFSGGQASRKKMFPYETTAGATIELDGPGWLSELLPSDESIEKMINPFLPSGPEPLQWYQYLAEGALILLAVAIFAFLMALLLSLSCNLSCSGNEFAAAAVLIGGVPLGIFLLVKAIRVIVWGFHPHRKALHLERKAKRKAEK